MGKMDFDKLAQAVGLLTGPQGLSLRKCSPRSRLS